MLDDITFVGGGQAQTRSSMYLKSFDMDSVQGGKAVFGKEIHTTLGIEPISEVYRSWLHSLGTRSAVDFLKVFTTNVHTFRISSTTEQQSIYYSRNILTFIEKCLLNVSERCAPLQGCSPRPTPLRGRLEVFRIHPNL